MRPIANTRSAAGIPTGRLAVWWVVASEIVIFGGLLASYVMHRIGNPEWAGHAAHTNVWLGGTNTFVLLTSSLSAVLAHKAAVEGDGKKAAKLLYYTCLGAVTFLIPILTPSFFKSDYCRGEVEKFLDREKQLDRNDLILPIYYFDTPLLNDPDQLHTVELFVALRGFGDDQHDDPTRDHVQRV